MSKKKGGASKRAAEGRLAAITPDDSDYAAANKVRRSEWAPPTAPSFQVLEQRRRLPLMSVLNFLAFDAPESPSEMSSLLRVARLQQAFKALCPAARDGEVELFGTPRNGDPGTRIDPPAFDLSLSLADEDGAIAHDLEAMPIERFVEFRWNQDRGQDRWVWRDVYVDRVSLVSWVKKLPAKTRRKATARGVKDCTDWLVEQRISGPPLHKKEWYRTEAAKRFAVGPDQFRTAWKTAANGGNLALLKRNNQADLFGRPIN
jgi:hypothetical protein